MPKKRIRKTLPKNAHVGTHGPKDQPIEVWRQSLREPPSFERVYGPAAERRSGRIRRHSLTFSGRRDHSFRKVTSVDFERHPPLHEITNSLKVHTEKTIAHLMKTRQWSRIRVLDLAHHPDREKRIALGNGTWFSWRETGAKADPSKRVWAQVIYVPHEVDFAKGHHIIESDRRPRIEDDLMRERRKPASKYVVVRPKSDGAAQ